MAPRCRLLELPRELRDMIYYYYVLEPDGLHFDYESGKLRTSTGQPVDLALTYTCTSIAAEMHSSALSTNRITFSTVLSETEEWNARCFDTFLRGWEQYREMIATDLRTWFQNEADWNGSHNADIDRILADLIPSKYPQFESLDFEWFSVGRFKVHSGGDLWLCKSICIDAIKSIFANPDNIKYDELGDKRQKSFMYSPYFTSQPAHWTIPTDEEIEDMSKVALEHPDDLDDPDGTFEGLISWRYSAAAAAIRFLGSLSPRTRSRIRNIWLHEDQPSVASPECHAIGLIPFCRENPNLHVTRKVNIWTTLLASTNEDSRPFFDVKQRLIADGNSKSRELKSLPMLEAFRTWISEFKTLARLGMPLESFSMVFDGDPIPEQSSELFELVKADATWQAVYVRLITEVAIERHNPRPGTYSTYFYQDFPEIVSEMIAGTSRISCNFPLGQPHDPQTIFEKHCRNSESCFAEGWYLASRGVKWKLFPPATGQSEFRFEDQTPTVVPD